MDCPRVLVVDDSRSVREGLKRVLGAEGFCVSTASNGAKGLEAACAGSYELVVTDLDMPEMGGFDLCRTLKTRPDTCSTPVLILSTRNGREDIEKGFQAGASGYVIKKQAMQELVPVALELTRKAALLRESTVLVVDDSVSIRNMISDGLRREGFRVAPVSTGQQGLDYLERKPVDLVLFDLDMPGMDGREFCRQMCARDDWAGIPRVVMSGTNTRAAMVGMIQQGASAFIAKPFRIEQLSILLERILNDQFQLILSEKKRAENERRLYMAAISSLVAALEARDPYTFGHSESVARIAVGIGWVLGFDEMQLERLEQVGRLHDIGKIGVRDDVLNKPDGLTDEEYEHIKTHTERVASILGPIESMADVLEAACSHHERFDGNGYPRGLAGEDIPLLGRIIAVADAYDAMTSSRPYRTGMPHDRAMSIIREVRGTQLCPRCVDAFVEYMECVCRADGEECDVQAGGHWVG